MTEAEMRAAVVTEAGAWLRTPFHHEGRLKGIGVDCLMLLAEVYERAGIIPHLAVPHYTPDWFLHRNEELYLGGMENHAAEVAGPPDRAPQPGDIIIAKIGRCFSHAGIVIQWPRLVHAYFAQGCVCWGNGTLEPFAHKELRFFNPFAGAAP
jgi:cell wall-associated NlpC family hydrolase